MCSFSISLILKWIMTFQCQRVYAFCWTKIKNLTETKWNRKRKIRRTVLERRTFYFSYKSGKLKSKTVMSWSSQKKKGSFFVPFILSEGNFLKICDLFLCIVYWIHFQKIHTFTYQKTLLHTPFYLFLKLSKIFSVSLKTDFTIYILHEKFYVLQKKNIFCEKVYLIFQIKCKKCKKYIIEKLKNGYLSISFKNYCFICSITSFTMFTTFNQF